MMFELIEVSYECTLRNGQRVLKLTNCWQRDDGKVQNVGREGWWQFPGGVCKDFLGEFKATIVRQLPASEYMRADRHQPIDDRAIES